MPKKVLDSHEDIMRINKLVIIKINTKKTLYIIFVLVIEISVYTADAFFVIS